jgi:hypothetical protein
MTQLRRLTSPGRSPTRSCIAGRSSVAIIGPVGSGKTMTAAQKLLRVGALQGGRPDAHGIIRRKARCGVIRESYPNIEANMLKTWFNIVPEEEGKFNWRAPYVHRFSKVLRRDEDRSAADRHSRHGSRVPRDRRQERRGSHPRLGNQRGLDRRI